jgi:hypothetical protein
VSRNPHRSSLPRRLLVWLVAFVVLGRVVRTPTVYELRRLSPFEVADGVVSFSVTMLAGYHLYVRVPNGILAVSFVWPVMLGACALAILAVQTVGSRLAVRLRTRSDGAVTDRSGPPVTGSGSRPRD